MLSGKIARLPVLADVPLPEDEVPGHKHGMKETISLSMIPYSAPHTSVLRVSGIALALCLALAILSLPPAHAQRLNVQTFDELRPLESGRQLFEGRRWRLTAERMATDHDAEIVDAEGKVLVRSGDDYLQADFARYFHFSEWIYLRGNVRVSWDKYYIEAEEAEFDLSNRVGWLKRGRIITEDPRISISSDRIEKKGDLQYSFAQAEVSACEDDPQAWSFKVSSATITQEDSAVLWNPRLHILDIPVLYFPILAFPTISTRESGLLYPDFGYSSRDGITYLQPLYIVIDDENDATLTEYYMTERGVMHDLEYRSTPDSATKLWLRGSWLDDRTAASTEAEEYSQFAGDGLIRPNHERYWLRGMLDSYLHDPNWQIKMDLDYVSDQNYLREFETGRIGYLRSRNTLRSEFSRDIATKDSLTRTSALLVSRQYDDYGMNLSAAYTQNLAYMNDNLTPSNDPTVQRLPEFSAFAYKTSLGETPFEWEAQGIATYFWRRGGTTGLRLDARPELSLPITSSYGSIIPSVSWRQTLYSLGRHEDIDTSTNTLATASSSTTDEDFISRGIPELSVSALSEISRTFDLSPPPMVSLDNAGESSWTKLRHTLQPRLVYTWRPDVNQDDTTYVVENSNTSLTGSEVKPLFDSVDYIQEASQLRYSLTNIFDRKRQSVVLAPQDGNFYLPQEAVDYRQFFRLRLEQYYDFIEASRTDLLDQYERRPFSDVEVEATLYPGKFVSLTSSTFFSPYDLRVTEHEHWLTLFYEDKASLRFGFDVLQEVNTYQRRDDSRLRTVTLGGSLHLLSDWILDARYEYDLLREEEVEREVALTYRHHCFDFQFVYFDDTFEQTYTFRVNLMGISSPTLSF